MSVMNDTGIIDPARVRLTDIPNCSLHNSVILWLYLKLCIFSNFLGFYKIRIEKF